MPNNAQNDMIYDIIMNGPKLNQDVTLYRGLMIPNFKVEDLKIQNPKLKTKFVSFSFWENIAADFAYAFNKNQSIILKVNYPKEFPCLWIDRLNYFGEQEALVPIFEYEIVDVKIDKILFDPSMNSPSDHDFTKAGYEAEFTIVTIKPIKLINHNINV